MDDAVADMNQQFGLIMSKESGAAKVREMQVAFEAATSIDLADSGFDDLVASLSEAVVRSRGAPINGELAQLLEGFAKNLALKLIEEITKADMLDRVEKGLGLWERISLLVSLHAADQDILATLRALLTCMVEFQASFGEEVPTVPLEDKAERVHTCCVRLQELEEKQASTLAPKEDSDIKARLTAKSVEIADVVRKRVASFLKERLEEKVKIVMQYERECIAATDNLHVGERWHKLLKGNISWVDYIDVASKRFEKVDTKILESSLASLHKEVGCGKDIVEAATEMKFDVPPETLHKLQDGEKNYKACKLVMHEALLLWHLQAEHDKDKLRLKVQRNVKDMRAMGVAEKEYLHVCLFKRAWELVTCKT